MQDAVVKMRELSGKEVSDDISEMDLLHLCLLDTGIMATIEGDDGVWTSFESDVLMMKCGPMPPQQTKPPHGPWAEIWVFFTNPAPEGACVECMSFEELQRLAEPPRPGEMLN
jgi:hypothetical protein